MKVNHKYLIEICSVIHILFFFFGRSSQKTIWIVGILFVGVGLIALSAMILGLAIVYGRKNLLLHKISCH